MLPGLQGRDCGLRPSTGGDCGRLDLPSTV